MGSKTTIQQPSAPTAPSVSSSINDYITNYPALFSLMESYMPREAQMQVALANQYAQPLGEAYKKSQDAMYPEQAAMSTALNQQITQGMSSDVPDWMKKEYQSNMNAQLGTNVNSGIGADYASRGLLDLKNSWRQYYQNMALSVTGRQPIYQAQTPQTTNQLSQFTPNSAMSMNSNIYGTQAGMYNNQYSNWANQQGQSAPWMNAMGSIGGSLAGGIGGGLGMGLMKKWD